MFQNDLRKREVASYLTDKVNDISPIDILSSFAEYGAAEKIQSISQDILSRSK